MVLLRSTICLLLIIVFPEAASIKCDSDCVSGTTKEGDDVKFTCQTPSASGTELIWDLSPIVSEQPEVPGQEENGGNIDRGFTWKVVAPMPQLVCRAEVDSVQVEACTTEPCNILYPPKNVVTSLQYFVSPGENITCTADGNPPPTFKWEENVDGSWTAVDGADGDTITAELKDGATYTELRCVAMGSNSDENAVSASVYVSKYGNTIRNVIIICVVVGVVIVGVISGVVYAVKK